MMNQPPICTRVRRMALLIPMMSLSLLLTGCHHDHDYDHGDHQQFRGDHDGWHGDHHDNDHHDDQDHYHDHMDEQR